MPSLHSNFCNLKQQLSQEKFYPTFLFFFWKNQPYMLISPYIFINFQERILPTCLFKLHVYQIDKSNQLHNHCTVFHYLPRIAPKQLNVLAHLGYTREANELFYQYILDAKIGWNRYVLNCTLLQDNMEGGQRSNFF